jgi:ribosome-associated protein
VVRPGARVIRIDSRTSIDEADLRETFIRASGPGGQNVNKVSTAVELRYDARGAATLPDDVRERLMRLAGSRLTLEGVIVILAQRFRTQERNRADALERLTALVRQAAERPKKRIATRPTLGSKTRRLTAKKIASTTKSLRRAPLRDI